MFLTTEINEAYTIFNDLLDWIIENWALVTTMVTSPLFAFYLLKFVTLYFGNKKGKEILDKMIDNLWQKMNEFITQQFNELSSKVDLNEKEVEDKIQKSINEIKNIENKIEAFNKTILDQKENIELKNEYEKILLQNVALKNKLNEDVKDIKEDFKTQKEDIKNKANQVKEDKEKQSDQVKNYIKSNKKRIDKKVDKVNKKIDKTKKAVKNNEISLD